MNLGSDNLAIGIALYMRDGFTANAATAASAMRSLRGEADSLARQQATLVRNSNAVGAAAGGLMLVGMGKAYQEYAKFNYIMRFTSLAADDNVLAMDKLSNKALEVGRRTQFSSKEVAEGMQLFAQAGMNSRDILASIDTAADLAASSMSKLGGEMGAADILAKITTSFHIEKTKENMSRVSDILAYGANKSLTDLTKFAEGMTYAQNTAYRLKMSLEDTTAAVMMLSNAGLPGTVTGTTLDNMMRYITEIAGGKRKRGVEALAKIGLSREDLMDSKKNLLPLVDIMVKLGKAIKNTNLGSVDKNMLAIDLFNVRGAKGSDLIDSAAKMQEFITGLHTNTGYSNKTATKLMDSPEGAILRMKASYETLRIKFGQTIAPIITPVLKLATKLLGVIEKIMSTPVGGFLAKFAAGFIFLKTVQMAYNATMLTIRLTQGTLGTSIMGTAATTTSSFGRMTTAATIYERALERIKMAATTSSGVGSIGQFRSGQSYQVGPGGGYIPLSRNSYKPTLSKINNFMGKASIPTMMGGMMLTAAAGQNPADNWGKAAAIGGDTLSFAATGAMIGSIVPGIGNAAGALVGAVGGLLYSLHNNLKDAKEGVESQGASKTNKPEFDKNKWLKEVDIYRNMKNADLMYNLNGSKVLDSNGNPVKGGRNVPDFQNSIIINIDGREIFDKTYQDNNIKEILNLGLHQ